MNNQKFNKSEIQKRKLEIATQLRVISPFPGEWESVLKGEGYDFADIRPYEPGDDIKRIHLPTLARTGDYCIIERVAEKQLKILMFVDFSGSMSLYQKSRIRTMAVGLITVSALHFRTLVGMAVFSDKVEKFIPYSIDDEQLDAILDLAIEKEEERQIGKKTDFGKLPAFLEANLSPKNMIFLISDFMIDDLNGLKKFLEISRPKYDLVPVIIRQLPDFCLPDFPCQVDWQDVETGSRISFSGSKKDFKDLNQRNLERFEELTTLFRESGFEYVLLESPNIVECFRSFSQCFDKKIRKRL